MAKQAQLHLTRMQEYMNKKEYHNAIKEAKTALNLVKPDETPYLTAVILLHLIFCQVQLRNIRQASQTYFQLMRFLNDHPRIVSEKLLLAMHGIALRIHDHHPSLSFRIWDLAWTLAETKNLEQVKRSLVTEIVPRLQSTTYQNSDVPNIHQWIHRALTQARTKREAFNLHLKNVVHALETKDLDEAQKSLEAAENLASGMVNAELLSKVKKLELAVLLKDVEWQLLNVRDSAEDNDVKWDENVIIAKIDKAEDLAREFNDWQSLFQAKLLRGLLFKYTGELTRALEEWKEAMELKDSGVPTTVIYQLTIQIALTLTKQGHLEQALHLITLIGSKIHQEANHQLQEQVRELKASLEHLLKERHDTVENEETLTELDKFPFFVVGPGTISFLRKEAQMIQEALEKSVESSESVPTRRTHQEDGESDSSPIQPASTTINQSLSHPPDNLETETTNEPPTIDADDVELHGQLNDLLSVEISNSHLSSSIEHDASTVNTEESALESAMNLAAQVSSDRHQNPPATLTITEATAYHTTVREETTEHTPLHHQSPQPREELLEREFESQLGDDTLNEALQGSSRELALNMLANLLQSHGYSVNVNLDAVDEPNIIAVKGRLKKHRLLISICEDPIDAGFASTLLAGHLLQGTKVVFLLNGSTEHVVGSKDVIIVQSAEEIVPLLK